MLPERSRAHSTHFKLDIHPEDRVRVLQAIREAIDQRRDHQVEYRIVRPDGTVRWVEGRGQLFCDTDGQPDRMVGVCSDITERKHAEERFRLAVEAAPAAMIMIDQSGSIRLINALTEQMLGYSRDEILGQSIERLVPERFRERHGEYRTGFFMDSRQRAMGSGRDLYALHKDGSEVAVEIGLSPINTAEGSFVLAAVTDITERKRAQQALAEQAHLLDLTHDSIFVRDLNDRIVYWNRGAEETYGWTLAEVAGKVTYNLLSTEFPQPLEEILAAVRRDGRWSGDLIHTRRDGVRIHVASRWSLDRDTEGRPAAILEINNDISFRKALEEAERQAKYDAERANHIKDEFLAVLSHELRTPLSSILGWASVLSKGDLTPEKSRYALQAIERGARAEARLVESLLDLSRIMSGKLQLERERLDLGSVVNAAVDTVRPEAQAKGIILDVRIPLSPILMAGDATRLQQIVWNLLTNAVKFTPQQGRIEIVLEQIDSQVQIQVTDNGQGIRADFLPYIFERFAQAESKGQANVGLGLGLAIVRELVQVHGGTIHADSPGEGKGSTFIVRLPLAPLAATPTRIELAPSKGATTEEAFQESIVGIRVLVVDDEADTRNLAATVLESQGAIVQTASTVADGLDIIDRTRPDVLLADLGMPTEDGYALIRKLRDRERQHQQERLFAIAMTAFAAVSDVQRSMTAGYDKHLSKPCEAIDLIRAVAEFKARQALGA